MNNVKNIYKQLKNLDYSIVDQKMKSINLGGNSIEEVKEECLRFLALCAGTTVPLAPSKIVDEYWHMMILNTKLYSSTAAIFGRFLHHVPSDGTLEMRAVDHDAYIRSIVEYQRYFGEPNHSIWGITKTTNCSCNPTCKTTCATSEGHECKGESGGGGGSCKGDSPGGCSGHNCTCSGCKPENN